MIPKAAHIFSRLAGLLACLLAGLAAAGQQVAAPDSLPGLSRPLAQYYRQSLTEQLYVHLDRPTYAAGETMWLQVYAVDGTFHRPLALSKVAYVEVLNAQQQPVLQAKLALRQATGHGSLALPADLPAGGYTVRAYTSWMQNFSPDFYFHCPVTILQLAQPSAAAPAAALSYDAQFFPEGGQFVQGLGGKVGLRVVGPAGQGLAATGTVLDAQGTPVATFSTLRYGLGSFNFTPTEAGAAYTATVQLATGPTLTVRLPPVQASGYTLSLSDLGTQLQLTAQAQGPELATAEIALLGHGGQRIVVARRGALAGGQLTFSVDKRALPDGITHFTLFDGANQPRCERLYFQPPRHPLALAIQANQAAYAPRQRVELRLTAPANASASLAVYQLDSLSATPVLDAQAYLLLVADLRGRIQNPGSYLRDSSALGRQAAENLMLTQGWSRFRWAEVLAGRPLARPHLAELNGHFVQASLTERATGRPAAGIAAYLATPSKTIRLYNAISQPDGALLFETNLFYGPAQLVLQTNWQHDSTYHLALQSPFSDQYAPGLAGPLALSPMLAAALAERYVQVQVGQRYAARLEHPYLQPPHDTIAFYGRPNERYLLDDYTRFPVLEEVMREYVPGVLVRKHRDGFHFRVIDQPNQATFRNDPLVLLDGVPVFSVDHIMQFSPLKIRKLDVITSHYYQGPLTYDGIVSYTTYRGDLGGFPLPPQALLEEYEGLQGEREFFAPRYDTPQEQASRRPDFRNLLHWQPGIRLAAGQPQQLRFFTSDQVGRYLVVAQGLADDGRPGSSTLLLEVKPPQ